MKVRRILMFILALILGFLLYSQGYLLGLKFLAGGPFEVPMLLRDPTPHPVTDTLTLLSVVAGAATAAWACGGSFLSRWVISFLYLYVLYHFIGAMEAAFFSRIGGTSFLMVVGLLPALLGSLGVSLPLGSKDHQGSFWGSVREFFKGHSPKEWGLRFLLAWLSFPAIYLFFGALVSPIVKPYYLTLDFLAVPSMGTLVPLQLARSLLIMAVVLPFFIRWKGTRTGLFLSFGLSFFALTGLSGLLGGSFLPDILRWVHGAETLADALAYAWVMTILFGREGRWN